MPQSTAAKDENSNAHASAVQDEEHVVQTDLLIVGAGPAGASLACFLAHYGSDIARRGK
jgi:ribulose 1,5-bisphosphate synthetase/thiazole synthase